MSKVSFSKQELQDMDLPWSALEDKIIDNSRWSIHHEIIFMKDEKYYRTYYSVGATEYQDERPWEYDKEVVCEEVHKVQKLVEVWAVVGE